MKMAEYKQKTKQFVINSAKQPVFAFRGDCVLFNLNACIQKRNNFIKFDAALKEMIAKGGTTVNFCNLASLCHKLELEYSSDDTFELAKRVIISAKLAGLNVVQKGMKSYGEIDMQPMHSLISYDKDNNVLYTNLVLVDSLKLIGYVDAQIKEIIDFTRDFRQIIPEDLIEEMPIMNERNKQAYERIKRIC